MNHFTYIEELFSEGINELSGTEVNAIQDFLEEQPDCRYRFKHPCIVYTCKDHMAMRCDGINMERETFKVNVEVIDSPNEIVCYDLDIYDLEYMSIHNIVLNLSLELPD